MKNKNKTLQQKRRKRNKTHKNYKCAYSNKSIIIQKLMEMLNIIKLYHWKTNKYSHHVATDDLYESLNKNIDKFVEIYLGKNNTRIKDWENTLHAIQYNRLKDFKSKMLEYREMLIDLNLCFDEKKDSDLLTVRDDILSDLNQFFYLLSFK